MINAAIALFPIATALYGIFMLERISRVLGRQKNRYLINAIRRCYPLWLLAALPNYWLTQWVLTGYTVFLGCIALRLANSAMRRAMQQQQILEIQEDGYRLILELQGCLQRARHVQQQRRSLRRYGCPARFRCKEMGLTDRGDCYNLRECQTLGRWPQEQPWQR